MLEKFHDHLAMYKFIFYTKSLLDAFPNLYINTLKIHRRGKKAYHDVINDETDIVIDGYPRSANSFALAAFRLAQTCDYNIATHVHTSSQIVVACQKNIPTLVLLRNPRDAVVSHKSLSLEIHNGDASLKKIPIELYLHAYIKFHQRIYPFRHKFVLGCFEEVTADFGKIVDKINEKFATNFVVFEHSKENVDRIFNSNGFHLSPSKKRNSFKEDVYAELEKCEPMLKRAQSIYESFLS